MATKNISDTMYDGTVREQPQTKGEEQNPPVSLGNFSMSNDEYISDVLRRLRPSRDEILRNAYEQTLSTPAAEYNGDVEGLGLSRLDSKITRAEQLEDLEDTRARLQKPIAKFANAIPKMAIQAGTVFADSYLGIAAGLTNVAAQAIAGNIDSWRDGWNAFVDNPVSTQLQQFNDIANETFVNYRTKEERDRHWTQNMGTANFWADNILSNAGFIIGAAAAGKSFAGMLGKAMNVSKRKNAFLGIAESLGKTDQSATEILKGLKNGTIDLSSERAIKVLSERAKRLKNANIAMKLAGSVFAASGEARIESINAMNEYEKELGDPEDLRLQARLDAVNELYEQHPEWFEFATSQAGGKYLQCVNPEGQRLLNAKYGAIDSRFQKYMRNREENREMIGNTVFGINMVLLSLGDFVQFGKMFTGQYDIGRQTAKGVTKKAVDTAVKETAKDAAGQTAKKGTLDAVERLAATSYDGTGKGTTLRRKVMGAVKNSFVEGQEEMNQSWASALAKYKGTNQVGEFSERLQDPEGIDRSVKFFKALGEGWKESWGNSDDYVEFFAGALMGALGLPSIEMKYNKRTGEMRKGVVMRGGAWDAIREENARAQLQNTAADRLNNRLKDPTFKTYYYGLVGRNSTEDGIEKALLDGDELTYDKYSHMQLINDLVMFDDAGRLQDFIDMIDSLSENATSDETISEVARILGDEKFSGLTTEKKREQISKNIQNIKDRVNEAVNTLNDLKVLYGNSIEQEQLQETLWATVRLNDINKQIEDLTKSLHQQAEAFRQYEKDNGLTRKENPENTQEENDLETLVSDRYREYLDAKTKKNDDNNITATVSRNVKLLRGLYESRADYMDMLSRLSDDPQLVTNRLKKRKEEINADKTAAETKEALKALNDIRKYSDLLAYMEKGEINRDVKNILEDAAGKGNQQAKFVLNATQIDKRVRDLIAERLAKKYQNEELSAMVADMQEVWRKHILEAESIDDMLSDVTDADDMYDKEFLDTLNSIIRSQRETETKRAEDTTTRVDVGEYYNHAFGKFEKNKDLDLYIRDASGNTTALPNGRIYYVDLTTGEVFSRDGSRIGIAYVGEKGNARLSVNTAKFTYQSMGRIGDDNLMPWDNGYGKPQRGGKKARAEAAMAKVQREATQQRKTGTAPFAKRYVNERVTYSTTDDTGKKTAKHGTVLAINDNEIRIKFDGESRITTISASESGNIKKERTRKQQAQPAPEANQQAAQPEAPSEETYRIFDSTRGHIDKMSSLRREMTEGTLKEEAKNLPVYVRKWIEKVSTLPTNFDEMAEYSAAVDDLLTYAEEHQNDPIMWQTLNILDELNQRHDPDNPPKLVTPEQEELQKEVERVQNEPEPEAPTTFTKNEAVNIFGFAGALNPITYAQPSKGKQPSKRKDGSSKTVREQQKENDCN